MTGMTMNAAPGREEDVANPRGGRLRRAARRIGGDIAEVYRRGGRGVVAAPLIAAIAILPEAAQHVAEIKLGMFQSIEVFRALANDPTRWAFGYGKVAGFMIAILAYARFHALGSVRQALVVRPSTLALIAAAAAASAAIGWVQQRTGMPAVNALLTAVSVVLQSALTLLSTAWLVENRALGARAAFTTHLPSAALLTLYLALAFGPAQLLHMANHKLALGQSAPVIWGLMAFDALWIGLFASLVGAAMTVGGRARLTWRGWAA